jgi:hypothetical protein
MATQLPLMVSGVAVGLGVEWVQRPGHRPPHGPPRTVRDAPRPPTQRYARTTTRTRSTR